MWLILAGAAGLAGAGEAVVRTLVRTRTAALISRVADVEGLDITLPPGMVGPALMRGRISHMRLTCQRMALPSLSVTNVVMDLYGLGLDHGLEVRAGRGELTGELSAPDVLSMAGVGGSLHLGEGMATMRWPRRSFGGVRIGLRLRPELDGDRIRLAPTPLSMPLPDLPTGVTVTALSAREDCMLITADLDLPRLLR